MKISSNFHDYYDVMRTADQDPDPLYVRVTKEIEQREKKHYSDRLTPEEDADIKHAAMLNKYWITMSILNPRYLTQHQFHSDYKPDWFHKGVIGVCGRVFPVIGVGSFGNKSVRFAFNPEKANKLVSEYSEPNSIFQDSIKRDKQNILNAMTEKVRWRNPNIFYFEDWSKLLEDNNIGDEAFRHFKAPVLLTGLRENAGKNLITINPRLGKYEFAQTMNPPEIYQELSMFIGNNLANLDRKEPRPITDILKAETKGFDKKSFRNQKNRKVFDRKDW